MNISKTYIGIITILLTVFAMSFADAIIKMASDGMTLWQIYVLREILNNGISGVL